MLSTALEYFLLGGRGFNCCFQNKFAGFVKVLIVLTALSLISSMKADCTPQNSEGSIMPFLTFTNSQFILIVQYEFHRGCDATLLLEDVLGLLSGFLIFSLMNNLRTEIVPRRGFESWTLYWGKGSQKNPPGSSHQCEPGVSQAVKSGHERSDALSLAPIGRCGSPLQPIFMELMLMTVIASNGLR